jgi:hypothetical protein
VLAARRPSPGKLSFAGLADLLAGLPKELYAAIPDVQREALGGAAANAARRPPGPRCWGPPSSRSSGLADERAVVVAVDDFHWLDRPSTSALEFALRRLSAERVRAILSVRSGEAGPLARLERDGPVARIELGPLSVASLHRVVSTQLGRTFPRPTLVRITQASGGNPLYALEIARLLERQRDRDPARLPVPESLQTLVASRVRSLPPETRDALLRAAALAQPDLRLVSEEALAPAEDAGLVRVGIGERIAFVHPLFASAVYSSASLGRRRAAHRALADAVRDPEERARHLALACDGPDESVAQTVEAAARLARLRGAPDRAAELTELALRLLARDGGARDALRLDLAEHLYLASDFQRASEVLEALGRELEPAICGHVRCSRSPRSTIGGRASRQQPRLPR